MQLEILFWKIDITSIGINNLTSAYIAHTADQLTALDSHLICSDRQPEHRQRDPSVWYTGLYQPTPRRIAEVIDTCNPY